MSRRTEVCREFVRGNCRFGSRCKFSHDTSQQQRQQPTSPFGFGVRNRGQHQPILNKGGNYYSPLTSSPRKDKAPPQILIKEHRCTDVKDCKLQIKEDLENEQPICWRLTCYAHGKYLVNDVGGDVSFEELRSHAYAAGKQGMPFDSVVQNERSLLAAKRKEFDHLLKNFPSGPASSSIGFPGTSIAQQEALKMSFGTSTPGFSSSPFGSSYGSTGPLQNSSQFSAPFGSGVAKDSGGFSFGLGATSGIAAAVATVTPIPSESLSTPGFSFGMKPSEPGPFMQGSSVQSGFGSSSLPFTGFMQDKSHLNPSFGHSNGASHDLFGGGIPNKKVQEYEMSNSLLPSQNVQTLGGVNVLDASMNMDVASQDVQMGLLSQQLSGPQNDTADIWQKGTWALGEVPEEEPPVYAR